MKIELKRSVVVAMFLFSGVIGIVPLIAQPDEKLHVYVWDFNVSNDSLTKFGTSFTNDFESQLVNLEKFVVLERRRFDRIMAHQDMENQISDIRNMSSNSKDNLVANRADAVFFGALIFDEDSGEFEITITLQDLEGIKLKQGNIVFKKGIIYDNANRKSVVADLLNNIYAKEVLIAKKEQFELVDEKLNIYRARVDEITKIYREVIEILLVERDPIEYTDEIRQKIEAYNEVWNDLNDNKGKYLQEFGSHWGKDRLRDFTDIYSKIMNDFHERFIRKLDDLRIDIAKFRRDQSSSKREKENKQKLIIDRTLKMTDDIRTELNNKIKPEINKFLDKLRDELIIE